MMLKRKSSYRTLPIPRNTCHIVEGLDAVWAHFCSTKPCLPSSIDGGGSHAHLRHTFVTMALQNGVDVKTVSSVLGHYSAGFALDAYAHVTTDTQLKAAQTMGNILSRAVWWFPLSDPVGVRKKWYPKTATYEKQNSSKSSDFEEFWQVTPIWI